MAVTSQGLKGNIWGWSPCEVAGAAVWGPHCSPSRRRSCGDRVDSGEVRRGRKGGSRQGDVHGPQERVPSPPCTPV